MKIEQLIFKTEWNKVKEEANIKPQLVLAFGKRELFDSSNYLSEIKELYPNSDIVISSGAGEIVGPKYIMKKLLLQP